MLMLCIGPSKIVRNIREQLERSLTCYLNLKPCFWNLDLAMVRDICVCLRKAAPAPAAEPEVAFLVHNLYKTMMKVVIFLWREEKSKCFYASFGLRIDQ